MSNALLLPESVMDEPGELKRWLARAFEYTATLPAKKKKGAKKPAAKKPAAKKPAAKTASKRLERTKRSGRGKAGVRKRVKA